MAYGRTGFTPSRQPVPDWIRNCQASAGGGQTIAKGDAVCRVAGVVVRATAGQDPGQFGFGVVLATYTTANRPFTFQTVKYIDSAKPGRADICFDPNQTYVVQCITSIGTSNFGSTLTIDQSAANPTTGLSGQSVTIPASASVNDLFVMIGIAATEEGAVGGKLYGAAANSGVEVKWNRHFLKAPVAGQ